jgi:hypothetical protein
LGLELRIVGFRFRVQGLNFRVQSLNFRVWGLGSEAQGLGFRVSVLRFGDKAKVLKSAVSVVLGLRVKQFRGWEPGSGICGFRFQVLFFFL